MCSDGEALETADRAITMKMVADGTTGWLYQPATGTIKANVVGNDGAGHAIIDY